jgi:hypothetical protein
MMNQAVNGNETQQTPKTLDAKITWNFKFLTEIRGF